MNYLQKLQGVINRMQKLYTLSIKCKPESTLSLLVENQGRINFGHKLHDFKVRITIFKKRTFLLSNIY